MRVIGGQFGSRRLSSPPQGVRPTSDRVREAIFSRLEDVGGGRVLDLYAGSGALGIEALSRGAEMAVFVDHSIRSLAVLRENLAALSLESIAQVVRADAVGALRRFAKEGACFDLVLVDPPYASGEVARVLDALVQAAVLAKNATVVVESAKRSPPAEVAGLSVRDQRAYGDTLVTSLSPAPSGTGRSSAEERESEHGD